MRKFVFIFVFLLLISVIGAGDDDIVLVSEEVVEEIEEEGKVDVIVILKDEVVNDVGAFSITEEVTVAEVVSDIKNDIEVESEISIINGFSAEVDQSELDILLNDDRVEKIEYDVPVHAFLSDSIPLINASLVHPLQIDSANLTGTGETVCVIDTGVNYTHPALGGCLGTNCKVLGGYDFVNDDEDPIDDHGHGTHVSGIIASNDTTYVGVAPNISLIAIKALDSSGGGSTSDVVSGIDWCVNNATIFNIGVISISLGASLNATSYCDSSYTSYRDSINSAVANDIIVSVASGNDGNSTGISVPACIQNSTTVSSTDKDDLISSFSNRNSLVDLLAPGGNITSTSYTGGTESRSGTSMSAPHVSGVIALLKQFFRLESGGNLTVSEVENNLSDNGLSVNDTGGEGLIFKRVNIYDSIVALDLFGPRFEIDLSNDTLELNQDNQTINVTFVDSFLDSSLANITLPNGTLLANITNSLELITDNLTALGEYSIYAWANDTNGNENFTTKTFLVRDTSGLSSGSFTLNNIEDNNYTDVNLVEFNITIDSKYNLDNATLSHNFTSWNENSTFDLSTNETTLVFNNTFDEGTYLWNVEACDVNNYCVNNGNKTLFIDTTAPVVILNTPLNGTNFTSLANVDLQFNVTDLAIPSCTLTFNGTTNETLSSVSTGAVNEFAENFYYLSNGNYTWDVACTDKVDKSGNSSTFNFNVACASESTFSRDCTSWSDCMGGSKTKLCYDANYCTSDSQNISSTFASCSSDDSSSPSSGDGSSSGGSSTKTDNTKKSSFKFDVKAGDRKKLSISKDVGISGLDINFKKAVNNADITVTKLDSKPSSVSVVSNVYKYIQISTDFSEEDVEEAKIEFKVEQSWININALGKSTNIFMNRYKDGKWVELETLTAGFDGIHQKYVAVTPGFSYFAVSANKNVVDTPLVTTNSVKEVEEVNETVEEVEVIGGLDEGNVLDKFTGLPVITIFANSSTYSLIGLGVVVAILVMFLVLRFRKKISRTSGVKVKGPKFAKMRWIASLGLLKILKKGKGKVVGRWEDVPRDRIDFKKKDDMIKHDFELHKGAKKVEEKEIKQDFKPVKKEGFFSKLKKKLLEKASPKKEEKPKQEFESIKKEGFFGKLKKKLKSKKEDKPKEEKPKKSFFKKLFSRKKKVDPMAITMDKKKEVKKEKPKKLLEKSSSKEKKSFFNKLFSRKKKLLEKPSPKEEKKEMKADVEPVKKEGFFSKLKKKLKGKKKGHDFEIK